MTANIFTLLRIVFFAQIGAVMRLGTRRVLEEGDMPPNPPDLVIRGISLEGHALDLTSPVGFVRRLLRNNRELFSRGAIFMLVQTLSAVVAPILIYRLISLVRLGISGQLPLSQALATAAITALAPVLGSIATQHYFHITLKLQQKISSVLAMQIYAHSLRISQTQRQGTPIGDLVNFMSSDAETLSTIGFRLLDFIGSLLVLLGGISLLFYFAGPAALAAIAVILLIVPLTRKVAPRISKSAKEMWDQSDERVTLIAQILRGIRVVKYFSWTKGMEEQVQELRRKELGMRMRLARYECYGDLGYSCLPIIGTIVLFSVRLRLGQGLDAAVAFSCVAATSMIQEPLGQLSRVISGILSARLSAQRLIEFFSIVPSVSKPRCEKSVLSLVGSDEPRTSKIAIRDLSVKFSGQKDPSLRSINTDLKVGKSTAIVGPVGSGKSTLLLALLGEVPILEGSCTLHNVPARTGGEPRLAWVGQEAFIMNGTLEENIRFGNIEGDVEAATNLAMLGQDISVLPKGLLTEIGDNGVNLSGGQKQRVSLARAVLQGPDLVLLDDPFSAIDPKTEKLIIENLVCNEWRGKTVIASTHRLTFLDRFDEVIFMQDGEIVAQGPYVQLARDCEEFRNFVQDSVMEDDGVPADCQGSQGFEHRGGALPEATVVEASAPETESVTALASKEEDRSEGAVGLRIYWDYLWAFGGENRLTFVLSILAFVSGALLVTTLPTVQDMWLAAWFNRAEAGRAVSFGIHLPDLSHDSPLAVAVYAVIGLLIMLATVGDLIFARWRSATAGRLLHSHALRAVLNSPVRFFDTNPTGRILNRFSGDVQVIDNDLAHSIPAFVVCVLKVAVTLTFTAVMIPVATILFPPVAFFYYRMQKIYRSAAREAKRMYSISRSPRIGHFKETLEGLAVIRAYGSENYFVQKFYDRLENNQRLFHGMVLMNRWFSTRVPLLSGSISLTAAVSLILLARQGEMLPGTAGMILGFVLSFSGSLNWAVRAFSDLETQMTAVERVGHFARLKSETSVLTLPALESASAWPTAGKIEFRSAWARYDADLPDVLQDVSFNVVGGSRTALVGRTGSGKSTILQTLFRLVELRQGTIEIDGVNIASIPLDRLRSAIAIIPQDPVLFQGTFRSNLDYFKRFDDGTIMESLRRVRMDGYVAAQPGGLDGEVLENGNNLSQGQRQLICLARAFLNKSKIIVLDEASASVDVRTDEIIQKTLREECAGLTVLVIAHRLETIADSDRTIELDAGRVKSIVG